MTRRVRWAIWSGGIFLLALLAFFPLRLAMQWSDLPRMGFTARQVAGTIWFGRIGELHLRTQNLGTFEVALAPFPLLVGNVDMRLSRLDSVEGPLAGRLVAGSSRGVVDMNGRIAIGSMFAPLPIEALDFENVTVLFSGGRCERASGRVRPVLSAGVPGIRFQMDQGGRIDCDGERARITIAPAGAGEKMDFYVSESGRYRGWLTVPADSPAAPALLLVGFRPTATGLVLAVDGEL